MGFTKEEAISKDSVFVQDIFNCYGPFNHYSSIYLYNHKHNAKCQFYPNRPQNSFTEVSSNILISFFSKLRD